MAAILHTKNPTPRFGTVAHVEDSCREAGPGWLPDLITSLVPCVPTLVMLLSLTMVDVVAGSRRFGGVFVAIMVAAGVVVLGLAVGLVTADRRDRLRGA